ncbi:hypothetical protein MRB53_041019 [Persea americana]|nr:hypothetical protein MRB53_041019 [Persea americana]
MVTWPLQPAHLICPLRSFAVQCRDRRPACPDPPRPPASMSLLLHRVPPINASDAPVARAGDCPAANADLRALRRSLHPHSPLLLAIASARPVDEKEAAAVRSSGAHNAIPASLLTCSMALEGRIHGPGDRRVRTGRASPFIHPHHPSWACR